MLARKIFPAVLILTVAACADHDLPTATSSSTSAAPSAASGVGVLPSTGPSLSAAARSDEVHLEALARRVARALGDPAFRSYVKSELDRSTFPEHKVQFQRFLRLNGQQAMRALAAASNETEDAVAADTAAVALEMYFPVPAHRAAWSGDANVLVATAREDHEAPIAFDLAGHRQLLDPAHAPATPVLAIVPVETDFDAPARPARMQCVLPEDCAPSDGGGGGDAGSGGGGTITPSVGETAGLYMTYAQYSQDFEGWLKGSPEFEIHIMGPAQPGDTTNLASFQCVGEHAAGAYAWDMNELTWSGSQLLFSNAQMDAFSAAYPGRAFVIFAVEDDDTACGIRTDSDRGNALLKALNDAYASYKAAKDVKVSSINGLTRILQAARSGSTFLSSLYSFLKSNDDIVGVAVADSVRGRYSPLTNWTALDKSLNTTAAFKLEIH
jgi:hypothetical protein